MRRRGLKGRFPASVRPFIGDRSQLWVDYSPTRNDPWSFCLLITHIKNNHITSFITKQGDYPTSRTSGSWRKRRRWRSWRCPCQPGLGWTPGNCWGSSAPSLWGRRRLSPHSERSPAALKKRERHLWTEMRWYAGDGAQMHRASNSVFCPQMRKVGCFLITCLGISLRGIAADDICHLRCVTGVAALAGSVLLKSSRDHKSTHPPLADKIRERTRRGRRSPPVKGTTKPSWWWLNLTRGCQTFLSTDPSRVCLGDGRKEPAFKGIFHVKSVNFIMQISSFSAVPIRAGMP